MHNVKNLKELAILELGEVRPSLWSILIDLHIACIMYIHPYCSNISGLKWDLTAMPAYDVYHIRE